MSVSLNVATSTRNYFKRLTILCLVVIAGGCAMVAGGNWDQLFGPAAPRERLERAESAPGRHYLEEIKPILEQRCVVCHGCYDSPCQLNLASPEGIDRGASKDKVYDSVRLHKAPLSRLFEDAEDTAGWRGMGFYPVLNEHQQTATTNLQASVMHHMLSLKRDKPLPDEPLLADSFDLGLDREQQCPKPEEIEDFKQDYPLWGMPYGLPGLDEVELRRLEQWLEAGSPMARPPMYGAGIRAAVERWESFLNGDSLKQQLMSRYLYEHWFLAHLYFEGPKEMQYFRLVRSATPPGEPIQLIATRRPYDDPGVARAYYRLWRDHSTVLDKTHMPYALDQRRMDWLQSLFLDQDYKVQALPSYEPQVAANPFIAFEPIPVASRWQFLLEEAQFTVMNFIKGPVCRGQVALDVIRDNFWVFLANKRLPYPEQATAFVNTEEGNLRIPAEAGNAVPFATWHRYAKHQQAYRKAKSKLMNQWFADGKGIVIDRVWDGDGSNQNAALTVFRHFDSATVVKGLVGPEPKTAWLIDYPILERIHYLLVAGFDVFGNTGHQLTTRLYMDFLRMEAEFNFLVLLPPEVRKQESLEWYQGADEKQRSYVVGLWADFEQPTDIRYQTDNPKRELFSLLRERLAPVLNRRYELKQDGVPAKHRAALERLQSLRGVTLMTVPEMVVLNVQGVDGEDYYYTVLHNKAHSNITSLFSESKNREPEEDTLTVVRGFLGSYPDAYWRVEEAELTALVDAVSALTDEASYTALMEHYGIRRTSIEFWPHSDKVIAAHQAADPIANGLFDYNRLENR